MHIRILGALQRCRPDAGYRRVPVLIGELVAAPVYIAAMSPSGPFSVFLRTRPLRRGAGLVLLALMVAAPWSDARADCGSRPNPGVDWTLCQKMRLNLKGVDLSHAVFDRTNLGSTDLMEANLSGATLTGANLARARLKAADLQGADLTKAQAGRTNFAGANLTDAILSKAELPRSVFTGANLTDGDLSKAELGRAVMEDAKLIGTSFKYANISRVRFRGARMTGADLTGAYTLLAHFEDTDLSETVGLEQDQLEIACGNEATKLPDGLTHPASWPCPE